MATVNSTCNRSKHGRGPLKATVRPKALAESPLSSGNIHICQRQHHSLSSSPKSPPYQLSAKSHSMDDLRDRGLPNDKKSLQDLVPVPLNTTRLRPIQQQTRRARVSITEQGTVTLESSKNSRYETLAISSDGMEVC